MEHDNDIAFLKFTLGEGAADLLEHDSGGRGSVVDEGNFVDGVSIDEALYNSSGFEQALPEVIEVEIIRLLKKSELPLLLSGDYGSGAASETTVVDSRDSTLVMRELLSDFLFGYESRELWLLGNVVVRGVAVLSAVGIHGRRVDGQARVWEEIKSFHYINIVLIN